MSKVFVHLNGVVEVDIPDGMLVNHARHSEEFDAMVEDAARQWFKSLRRDREVTGWIDFPRERADR